jgi:hypothetical protein
MQSDWVAHLILPAGQHLRVTANELTAMPRCGSVAGIEGDAMPRRVTLTRSALALAIFAIMSANGAGAAEADRAVPSTALRLAQAAEPAPPPRVVRTRPRIEVYPARPTHRECVDGYREVWRPYWGTTVVMPYMRCWWVRG